MKIFNHFQQINLTDDQYTALEKLSSFIDSDNRIFLLKGYAGTGKTTLLKGISNYLIKSKSKNIHLMAPTGRAAMVITQKTNLEAFTIHKSIYNFKDLKETENESSFKFYYGINSNETPIDSVYLIDEASMISDNYSDDEFFRFGSGYLLSDLIEYAFTGDNNRKIIFIGDTAQLPPVGMNFSPSLNENYITKNYNHFVKSYTLRKVVRQKNASGILNTASTLRKKIDLKSFNEFQINYDFSDVSKNPPELVTSQYRKLAKENGVENNIIITHSNKQALSYNEQIRNERYGSDDLKLQRKDILIITKNNYNYQVEIYNGMFAKVLEVGDIVYSVKPKFKIKGGKTIERHLIFREVVVQVKSIHLNKVVLKTTLIDNFLTSETGRLHPYDQRALYIDFKTRMADKGIKPKDPQFKQMIQSDDYFNALQAKYGYAITCHKSQGGEWPITFVDFKIFIGKLSESYYRWCYTAITRATKSLNCIDAPSYNALSHFIVKDISKLTKIPAKRFFYPRNLDFIEYRLKNIFYLFKNENIEYETVTHNNQIKIKFQKDEVSGIAQLWYKKGGFTKTTWERKPDEISLEKLVNKLLIKSLIPSEIPFKPKFKFQSDLNEYFQELLDLTGILCTNIEQQDWYDRYHLITDADCAVMTFNYNSKYYYTYAQPQSLNVCNDYKLKTLVDKMKGQS